jgi:hypothetical protein
MIGRYLSNNVIIARKGGEINGGTIEANDGTNEPTV